MWGRLGGIRSGWFGIFTAMNSETGTSTGTSETGTSTRGTSELLEPEASLGTFTEAASNLDLG